MQGRLSRVLSSEKRERHRVGPSRLGDKLTAALDTMSVEQQRLRLLALPDWAGLHDSSLPSAECPSDLRQALSLSSIRSGFPMSPLDAPSMDLAASRTDILEFPHFSPASAPRHPARGVASSPDYLSPLPLGSFRSSASFEIDSLAQTFSSHTSLSALSSPSPTHRTVDPSLRTLEDETSLPVVGISSPAFIYYSHHAAQLGFSLDPALLTPREVDWVGPCCLAPMDERPFVFRSSLATEMRDGIQQLGLEGTETMGLGYCGRPTSNVGDSGPPDQERSGEMIQLSRSSSS